MMKRFIEWRRTLRVRFALWVAQLLLLGLVISGILVYLLLAYNLRNSLDDALRIQASQVSAVAEVDNGKLKFSEPLSEENTTLATQSRDRNLSIFVYNQAGKLIQQVGGALVHPDFLPNPFNQTQDSFVTITLTDTEHAVRVYAAPILDQGTVVGFVQVARSLEALDETLDFVFTTLLIGTPILILFAAIGGYFLAARALAPIDQMTRTAHRIANEQDLSQRLTIPSTNDEVGRLAATFDEMLERLEETFKRERRFTSDASHELRTPLAAMQSILTVVRQRPRSNQEYEEAMDDLIDETNRLSALADKMLQLARGQQTTSVALTKVDLSQLLHDVCDSLGPLAEEKGLRLTEQVAEGILLQGNYDDLLRLFLNLLDNAIKFTKMGSVTLTSQRESMHTVITIEDTGVGIAPEHLPHLFERFYRVEQARTTRGAGLGLAIAQEIAKAHGGKITVTSQNGNGTIFLVNLPLDN